MTAKFRKIWKSAVPLAIVLIAAGTGPLLQGGEEDAAGTCLEQLTEALAIADFFWHDSPAILAGLTEYFLRQYLFCLRYRI